MADVRMPDGQIVTNVPDDMDPDELLKNYSSHLATQPKQKESSVFEAMKQGAKQAFSPEAISEYGAQIPPAAAARMAAPINMAAGMARIPANLMSWAGINEPKEAINAAQEGAKNLTESAGYTGMRPGLSNLGGEAAFGGAALKLASKAAPAIEAMGGSNLVKSIAESPTSQAILGGMGLGAAGSTGSPYSILEQAGLGGAVGLGGQAVASSLGHLAAPVLKRFNELKDLGYSKAEILKDTTIGQLLGGKMQAFENMLSDIPFSGVAQSVEKGAKSLYGALENKVAPILGRQKAAENILDTSMGHIKTGETRALKDAEIEAQRRLQAGQTKQTTSLEDAKLAAQRKLETEQAAQTAALKSTQTDVHIPAVNYALKPLGIEIPEGTTGNEAMRIGQKAISDAYNESLKNFSGLRLTKSVQDDLNSLTNTYNAKYLGKDNAKLFKHDIERLIGETSKGKWLTPDNWQRNLSQLSKEAYSMRQKDHRYSQALYDLKDKWMDVIEGQVGSDLFKSANTAFSKFKVPERAAAYANSIKAGGEFSPNELVNALKAEMTTKRLAGGEDELQQLAVGAHNKFMGEREALANTQSLAKQSAKDLLTGENRALAEKQSLATQNFKDLFSGRGRTLEDKLTGMQNTVAAQKAALKGQAEKQIGTHEAAIKGAIGPERTPEGKRVGYALGTGSLGLGGYGLTRLGVDPLTALTAGGGTILGAKGLYSSPVQNWLKQKALAQRPQVVQAAGETLKANAPVAGLTAVQERQRMANEEEPTQTGGLPVPQ
jgi:hypothetical protein